MTKKFYPYPDESQTGSFKKRFKVVIRTPYGAVTAPCSGHPAPYDCLTEKAGVAIKHEKRTRINLWETPERALFFKHYLYFGLSQVRTIGSMPKAEREYLTLGYLRHLKIPCVEAAGWGVRWNRAGGVQRCFILTVKEENTLDFRAWLSQTAAEATFRDRAAFILKTLGGYFRQLHTQGFFLLRPNTRNVLIRDPKSPEPVILFLDQPYARFLSGPGALWGQLKDLSTLLGGALRHLEASGIDDFLETYLPDPLGRPAEALRRRLLLALRARESDNRAAELFLQFRALMPDLFGQKGKK